MTPRPRPAGPRVPHQVLCVSVSQSPGRRGQHLVYAPGQVDAEVAPPREVKAIHTDALRRKIDDVRQTIGAVLACAVHRRSCSTASLDAALASLGEAVLPKHGLLSTLYPHCHPQFDLCPDAAAGIPWEALTEPSVECPSCRRPVRTRDDARADRCCQECGRSMEFKTTRLALACHMTHLVRGRSRPPGNGREFLLIKGPLRLARAERNGVRELRRLLAKHVTRLEHLLTRAGFTCRVLDAHEATVGGVSKAIVDRSLLGIYYFGHGDFKSGEGSLLLRDGRLYAHEIEALEVAARLIFVNACHAAGAEATWRMDDPPRSVAAAFAQGGTWKTVVAPAWPVVGDQAIECAQTFFETLLGSADASAVTFAEALRVVRERSVALYEQGRPDLSWMAYRYFGDPNNDFGSSRAPVSPGTTGVPQVAPSGSSRCWDGEGELRMEGFAFAFDEVLFRATKRRNLQHRRQVSVSDLLAGLLRRGDLTRWMVREAGADPDRVYERVLGRHDDSADAGAPHDEAMAGGFASWISGLADGRVPDEETMRRLFSGWLALNSRDHTPALIAVLEAADQRARQRAPGDDTRVSEQDLVDVLLDHEAWGELGASGLPGSPAVKRALRSRDRVGVDDNGGISLARLDQGAQRVVHRAHNLAQQKGIRPISQRLMLAAFLHDPKGVASRLLGSDAFPAEQMFEFMITVAQEGEDGAPSTFGLSPDVCARILLPTMRRAEARSGARAVTEEDLFWAYCVEADPGFKQALASSPVPIDLDAAAARLAPASVPEAEARGEASRASPPAPTALEPDAERAVAQAHAWAQERGAQPVPMRYVLAALLAQPEGVVARVTRAAGVRADAAVEALRASVTAGAPCRYALDAQALPMLPALSAAARRWVPQSELVGAGALFKAVCEALAVPFKQRLKAMLGLDLDALAADVDAQAAITGAGAPSLLLGSQGAAPSGSLSIAPDEVALPLDEPGRGPLEHEARFTLYPPRALRPERPTPLVIFLHDATAAAAREVAARARGLEAPFEPTTVAGRRPVALGATMTLIPTVTGVEGVSQGEAYDAALPRTSAKDVEFWPSAHQVEFTGNVERADFLVRAGRIWNGHRIEGRITVYWGVLVIADLPFRIHVGEAERSEPCEPATVRPYQKIFASYAHQDEWIVRRFEATNLAQGNTYLRDVHSLRSGGEFRGELRGLIDQADVFQLFWSSHAMASRYVREEWSYALALKRPGPFVRPTYWERPLPTPSGGLPPELRELHFAAIDATVFVGPDPPPTPQFDARVARVLDEARQSAARRGAPQVRTPHVAAALLADADGPLARACTNVGVRAGELRELLLALVPPHAAGEAAAPDPALSDNAQRVLCRAADVAREQGRRQADVTDLVAAVCDDASGTAVVPRALARLGLAIKVSAGRVEVTWLPARRDDVARGPGLLQTIGRDLTQLARAGALGHVAARDEELERMIHTLLLEQCGNPLLVGEPGTGKTALVEGLALRLAGERCPARLGGVRVIELSAGALVADTRLRGDFEKRMQQVLAEARTGVVLFLDEIHALIGAGGAGGDAVDAGDMLKAALSRGELRLIGATTHAEYERTIGRDRALARRFQIQRIAAPGREATLEMLCARQPQLEAHHGVSITAAARVAAVELSERYMTDRQWPAKARDLLDHACASAVLAAAAQGSVTVTAQHVESALTRLTGLAVSGRAGASSALEQRLSSRVVGQREAIRAVVEAVGRGRDGLADSARPWGVFLFVGSPGVGKTELARALADEVFGGAESLVRFDMGEFTSAHSVEKLTGAPPSYVGYDDGAPLVHRLRRRPSSLVLFDEIEHAHQNVLAVLLRLFAEGTLTDASGNTADARHSLIVLTSNILNSARPGRRLGFDGAASGFTTAREPDLRALVAEHLPRALVDRFDAVVAFRPLGATELEVIARQHVALLIETLARRDHVTLDVAPDVYAWLARQALAEHTGARAAIRAVDQHVRGPLAAALASTPRTGGKLHVTLADDRVQVEWRTEMP